MQKILLSWSGGKDSAWSLHVLRQEKRFEVVGLLTSVNEVFRRVALHGFREELLDLQAEAAGLPLWKVPLPFPCTHEQYEARMSQAYKQAQQAGLNGIAFGDLFLEEVRAYRETSLDGTGLVPLFPLWGSPTGTLARRMMGAGLRARLVCCDPRAISASFAGREWDAKLLQELPDGVDPCGEHGEFHTFAYDGPIFRRPIPFLPGPCVERDGFQFADLLVKA